MFAPDLVTHMLVPSNASPCGVLATGTVDCTVAEAASITETELPSRFETQILVPSKATPTGPVPTGTVPRTVPLNAMRVTALVPLFATHILTPSLAIRAGPAPTAIGASVEKSFVWILVTVFETPFVTHM